MSNLRKVEFSEFGEIITGKTPSSAHPEDFGNEIPFITPSDSFDQKYINSTQRYLSSEGVRKLKGKLLPENSVLVTCIGSAMGKVAMTKTPSITNQQINAIKINKNFDPAYIYYCLKNNYKLLRNAAGGSTALPLLNKTEFERLSCNTHINKSEQEKISLALSLIDKRIDLNSRINAELEAMAKTLYDYWFVQFDFPDANGKPYKTSGGKMEYNATLKREIPAGWNSCKLSEFIKLEYGKPLKSEYRTGSGYPVFGSSGIVGFHVDYLVEGPGLIIGRKGTVGKVNYSFENFYPIDTAYYVSCKKITSMIFLNYLINSLGLEGMNSDSAVPGLNREATLDISIVSAPLELISKYHEYAESWFEKKKIIVEENNALIKLRDWLLPMLMNGQVTVR
ncbi:restriction endonuclease subunit S [Citrobacter braakii]|uniref:restriction endonuclease subunit S n=1 Tax=Citrobacter braakii TaxID=57706 RepID=UPI001C69C019|nr:restriction endonuclease subunit S [Citrobacter braakii]MDV0579152.1 restriction endonuclease subunit S [Citrobacter braakii]MEB0650856.1 restriction endonuclease subunit S [Citrobacter braakii]QYO52014.1 restriction endonuclease subunit S [Citrobacter braakii]HCQ0107871.1 restriction endonuclease subunit S [Citrobacter braakii]